MMESGRTDRYFRGGLRVFVEKCLEICQGFPFSGCRFKRF